MVTVTVQLIDDFIDIGAIGFHDIVCQGKSIVSAFMEDA